MTATPIPRPTIRRSTATPKFKDPADRAAAIEAFVAEVEWPSDLDRERCVRVIRDYGGDLPARWADFRDREHVTARVAAMIYEGTQPRTATPWARLRRHNGRRADARDTAADIIRLVNREGPL